MNINLKIILFAGLFISGFCNSQVGIGTTTPNSSAALDLTSTNKGLLLNKVNLQSNVDVTTIPSPATGLIVYATGTHNAGTTTEILADHLYFYSGTKWEFYYDATTLNNVLGSLKIPVIGMFAYSKIDFPLSGIGNNIITYPDTSSNVYFNTTVMQRVSDSVFKANVKGAYMIDGFMDMVQNSTDISWGMKIQVSTDGGTTWSPNPTRGNYCNHSIDGGNIIPVSCLYQDSFVLNANDLLRVVVYKRTGIINATVRLDATATRYSSGFKIICYPL